MIAHLLVPYEDIEVGDHRGRQCAMNRWTPELARDGGYWSDAEIDGNHAIVRVRSPEKLLKRIRKAEGWQLLDRPGQAWTATRAKPREDTFDRFQRAACRPLASLMLDVRDDQAHDRHRRGVQGLIHMIEADGYHRLQEPDWPRAARLLTALAGKGYALDRVSTGTFPTQGILDQFTGANATSPPNASWTNQIAGIGSGLEIQSNACETAESVLPNNYGTGFYNVTDYGPDAECYCTISDYSGENDRVGVGVRLASAGTSGLDGYAAHLDTVLGAANDTVNIYRIDNAVLTTLGATITQEMAAGEKLGIEAIGTTITVYRHAGSWASIGNRTDGTYSAAGKIGLWTRSANGTMRMDDFGGGTVSAGGGGGGTGSPKNLMLMRVG